MTGPSGQDGYPVTLLVVKVPGEGLGIAMLHLLDMAGRIAWASLRKCKCVTAHCPVLVS